MSPFIFVKLSLSIDLNDYTKVNTAVSLWKPFFFFHRYLSSRSCHFVSLWLLEVRLQFCWKCEGCFQTKSVSFLVFCCSFSYFGYAFHFDSKLVVAKGGSSGSPMCNGGVVNPAGFCSVEVLREKEWIAFYFRLFLILYVCRCIPLHVVSVVERLKHWTVVLGIWVRFPGKMWLWLCRFKFKFCMIYVVKNK